MIPTIIEKLGHVVTVAVLHGQVRISAADAMAAGPDLRLGILFIAAFAKTPTSDDHVTAGRCSNHDGHNTAAACQECR
jgi:hypothetical protein